MTSAQRIESEAAQWAVRLSDKPLSDAEQSELDEWLAADIRHGGALLRAQAAWDDVDRLAALASGTELAGAPPEVTRSSALDADSKTKRRSGDSVLRWGVMHRAVAAAILIAVGAYFYLY
ncbi:FecR/PupR family sigma factor regulator, partial [Steroidobacter sp.]|uniref:FecR/PupR family sigma factor regulator n=1 Tax=Steroidobacter sp. TaxID=1978227 RepID=UPI001A3D018A